MKNITKKLNEVKPGDTLYCIAYGINGKEVSIVELTAKEVITNGPDVTRRICSREAIIVKEKVPNSPEPEGEYVIDQYYRGDECATHSYGIYTTFLEAAQDANKEIADRCRCCSEELDKTIKKVMKKQSSLIDSLVSLNKSLKEYEANCKHC
jgi:hypothetical protein